jgi:hypothetical protein
MDDRLVKSSSLAIAISSLALAGWMATMVGPVAYAQAPTTVLGIACVDIEALGFDKQTNQRAAAIRAGCGLQLAGASAPRPPMSPAPESSPSPPANVDIITGTETLPKVTQDQSVVWSSDGRTIVVNYSDSRTSPSNYSGVSVSTDAGVTWTRLLPSPFATGHQSMGQPILGYNAKLATWFAGDIVSGTGMGTCTNNNTGQGIGLWTSLDGINWSVGACADINNHNSGDDNPTMWVDNNPASPHYGRMYISYNDFGTVTGEVHVVYSDDGAQWFNKTVHNGQIFHRSIQVAGGPDGTVFIAAMDEGGGGSTIARTTSTARPTAA